MPDTSLFRTSDIEVPARYYLRLLEMLAHAGIDTSALLGQARISARSLQKPDAMLRYSQVERLINIAYDAVPQSDLGLELGRTLSMSTHSMVGFGMLSSPNVEHSLQFVARFFRLVMPSFSMRYTRNPQQADVRFQPRIGMGQRSLGFHIEAIAAAAYREILEMCHNIPPFRIALSIEPPAHVARYAQMDRAQWHFRAQDKPGIHIHFNYSPADYPLAMSDPNALGMAEDRCNQLLKSVAADGRFKEWVQMMLREARDGFPALSDLAALLNVSPRTLDRHLQREGTGFRELALAARHDLARQYLKNDQLSITEIAHTLGYSDAANFTRAFRMQSGCSPREFRTRNAG